MIRASPKNIDSRHVWSRFEQLVDMIGDLCAPILWIRLAPDEGDDLGMWYFVVTLTIGVAYFSIVAQGAFDTQNIGMVLWIIRMVS